MFGLSVYFKEKAAGRGSLKPAFYPFLLPAFATIINRVNVWILAAFFASWCGSAHAVCCFTLEKFYRYNVTARTFSAGSFAGSDSEEDDAEWLKCYSAKHVLFLFCHVDCKPGRWSCFCKENPSRLRKTLEFYFDCFSAGSCSDNKNVTGRVVSKLFDIVKERLCQQKSCGLEAQGDNDDIVFLPLLFHLNDENKQLRIIFSSKSLFTDESLKNVFDGGQDWGCQVSNFMSKTFQKQGYMPPFLDKSMTVHILDFSDKNIVQNVFEDEGALESGMEQWNCANVSLKEYLLPGKSMALCEITEGEKYGGRTAFNALMDWFDGVRNSLIDNLFSYPCCDKRYSNTTVRISSYSNWNATIGKEPREMALAGFYFLGFGDAVKCFCCGIGISNWSMGDDPWVEHARYKPTCAFLKCNKKDGFICLVMNQLYGNDGRAVVVKNDGKNKKHSGEKNKQNDGDLESMVIDKLKMMKVEYNDNAKSIFKEKIALMKQSKSSGGYQGECAAKPKESNQSFHFADDTVTSIATSIAMSVKSTGEGRREPSEHSE